MTADTSSGGPPNAIPQDDRVLDEQLAAGDRWEAAADERERLADERVQLADERERLADERERIADEQARLLEQRTAEWREHHGANGGVDDAVSVRDAEAQVRRAEQAVERAEAERERAQAALECAKAGTDRRTAADDRQRAGAARPIFDELDDGEELRWWSSRRDFVAGSRADDAVARDGITDARDELADRRERMDDRRDQELATWERELDGRDQRNRRGLVAAAHERVLEARARLVEGRAVADRQRRTASTSRQAAARRRDAAAPADAYGPALLASFGQLSRVLFATDELGEILRRVTDFAVGAIDGCDAASATILRNGTVALTIASDPSAAELDAVQFDSGTGPSVIAVTADEPVAAVLVERPEWRVLSELAAERDVASTVAYGLAVKRPTRWEALGVLTLYRRLPDGLDDEARDVGATLAAYASVAAAFARDRDELRRREAALHRALQTRDVIGQAKGVLMERLRLDAGQAFDVLRQTSQRLNRKLGDVATRVAETGELPD